MKVIRLKLTAFNTRNRLKVNQINKILKNQTTRDYQAQEYSSYKEKLGL